MIRAIAITCLIISALQGVSDRGAEIFLMKVKTASVPGGAEQPSIGIISAHEFYYKLMKDGEILQGGLLKPGLNRINLIADEIFQKSADLHYTLILKKGRIIKNQQFTISVTIHDHSAAKRNPEKPAGRHSLSMYIQNRMMGIRHKKIFYQMEKKIEKTISDKHVGPLDPRTGRFPALDHVDMFKMISSIFSKKKQAKKENMKTESRLKKPAQLTFKITRLNKEGKKKPAHATVRLHLH